MLGSSPLVQLNNKLIGTFSSSIQQANEVCKKGFPNPKLKLVQQIHNQHSGWIELRAEALHKCVLNLKKIYSCVSYRKRHGREPLTSVGTPENALSKFSTAEPLIGFANW
jgi:hypothetical protein